MSSAVACSAGVKFQDGEVCLLAVHADGHDAVIGGFVGHAGLQGRVQGNGQVFDEKSAIFFRRGAPFNRNQSV